MKTTSSLLLGFGVLALAACESPYPPTPHPDYAIRVMPTTKGSVAIPPTCPDWATSTADPFDNLPMPQFGCADARNLAGMIENPNDLLEGRALADARGVTAVGAVRRYDNNQTRGLITPSVEVNQIATTTATVANSQMTGDITAGGSSKGGSMGAP